jgi:hypothetical protein
VSGQSRHTNDMPCSAWPRVTPRVLHNAHGVVYHTAYSRPLDRERTIVPFGRASWRRIGGLRCVRSGAFSVGGVSHRFAHGARSQRWVFDREELPWVGDALEGVGAAISEPDSGAADEIDDGT